VKSFGAAIQTQVPLDANPDFEAFRKQIDLNKANTFTLGGNYNNVALTPNPVLKRPRPPRSHTFASDVGSETSFARSTSHTHQPNKMDIDVDHDTASHDSAYVSADSKRNSESSLFLPPSLTGQPRFESPRPMSGLQHRTTLTRAEDRDPRLSLMEHKIDPPSPSMGGLTRAATLPHNGLDGPGPLMILGDELKDLVKSLPEDDLLILDIRSAQNYATSRIKGALNLCIPTTLLKRATFNIQRLQQTFQGGHGSAKFANWRKMSAIVVYDSHSSDQKDAIAAQNMIKKFSNEGYTGKTAILKGGFTRFKETHPKLVDSASPNGDASQSNCTGGGIAPVIGGVSLPMGTGSTNPFFSNIRQNMDLADGVGQLQVSRPEGINLAQLPLWLRRAASQSDKGKAVSEKFLKIEKDEKSRMQTAYAAFDPHTAQQKQAVQLCGVEKGGKNRYKDILPFEHARVKLRKDSQSCDYVNASHIKSSMSNKRYIASQGPLPATFEVSSRFCFS
jgi:protein-tyrosine phosphatase